jgi:AmmeMemoRadiSam system protein B
MSIRPAAVAGSWYPGHPGALARDLDEYLEAVGTPPAGRVQAIIAPHAGLMFSGPVGAYAYKAAATGSYDVAVLVGPSHFVAFEGVALWPDGAFETPLGAARIDAAGAGAIAEAAVVHRMPSAHTREHSLEMQLPFLRRVLPDVSIVPLLMGFQDRETIVALASALATAFRHRRALLVASTDLSHYFDAEAAGRLDAEVQACMRDFDPDRLFARFESFPEHERGRYVACGGGPMLAVMLAARELGATSARVLKYAHSGEISGDYSGVVGYLAAAIGSFDAPGRADTGAH